MRINWTSAQVSELRARLSSHEDATSTGPDEYVVDLYDFEPTLSMELALGDGVDILTAERMAYSEELSGYYNCAPERDLELLERALASIL